jgi:hypothetical protein
MPLDSDIDDGRRVSGHPIHPAQGFHLNREIAPSDGHVHVSHSVGLTAPILDPATAQDIVIREERWSENKLSISETSSEGPVNSSAKNEMAIESQEKLPADDLERQKSRNSLALMMENFPDGGKWAWLSLAGASMIAFCTFGTLCPEVVAEARRIDQYFRRV